MLTNETPGWSDLEVAANVARDFRAGFYVNLGIGLPELVSQFALQERAVTFHSENGLLGMGPIAAGDHADRELINAGKKCVRIVPGASYCHHADSFAMVRGGHIDVCVLGALQVSASGDVANWSTGEPREVPAVGGAMDLAVGARRVWVMMRHTSKSGSPKIVQRCSYPLTASGVVTRVYTELAVLERTSAGLVVTALAPGVTFDHVQARTDAALVCDTSAT